MYSCFLKNETIELDVYHKVFGEEMFRREPKYVVNETMISLGFCDIGLQGIRRQQERWEVKEWLD